MKFIMQDDIANDERIYTLRIRMGEMVCAPLNRFDKLLLADCEGSNKVSDKLLALETIARRIEERQSAAEDSQGEKK